MRSQLSKETRKLLQQGILSIVPPFKQVKPAPALAMLFSCSVATNLTLYLEPFFSSRYDHFDIYMAWTDNEKIPDVAGTMPPPESERSDLFLLRDLWGGRKFDLWWELAPRPSFDKPASFFEEIPIEQCLLRVKPTVNDALRHINEYAIPYFAQVAASRGLRLPGRHE